MKIIYFLLYLFFSSLLLANSDNVEGENHRGYTSYYLDEQRLSEQRQEDRMIYQSIQKGNEIGFNDVMPWYGNDDEISFFEKNLIINNLNTSGTFLHEDSIVPLQLYDTVRVIPGSLIEDYDFNNISNDLLNITDPIFFVSEGPEDFMYENTVNFCNLVNNSDFIDCLVYIVEDDAEIIDTLRRGEQSDSYDNKSVSADFIIVREDIFSQYKQGTGDIALAPDLDLVMYLNGDYMFMFASTLNNLFSFEQLSALNRGETINVAFFNETSRLIFERTLATIFDDHIYQYVQISLNNFNDVQESLCNPTNNDIFIHFGSEIPDLLKRAMIECPNNINPITLSDETVNEVVQLTDFFSIGNIADYYPSTSILNYLEIYLTLESVYNSFDTQEKDFSIFDSNNYSENNNQEDNNNLLIENEDTPNSARRVDSRAVEAEEAQLNQQANIDNIRQNVEDLTGGKGLAENEEPSLSSFLPDEDSNNQTRSNFIGGRLLLTDETVEKLEGRENDNSIIGDEKYLRNYNITITKGTYDPSNQNVKTFGIRYVLLASRYAKGANVNKVFDSVMKNFFLTRESYLTPDFRKFSISDIILGSGMQRPNTYHPGLSQYPLFLLQENQNQTEEQQLAVRMLAAHKDLIKFPESFSPGPLTQDQLDILYLKSKELHTRQSELSVIKLYQRDISQINEALTQLSSGEEISDSLLKVIGLNNINRVQDNQSVADQGIPEQTQVTPDISREIDKVILDVPEETPTDNIVAEDIRDSVESFSLFEDEQDEDFLQNDTLFDPEVDDESTIEEEDDIANESSEGNVEEFSTTVQETTIEQ